MAFFFEAGNIDEFADSIPRSIKERLGRVRASDCIVLAQASMRVAPNALKDVIILVQTSPLMAAKRSIQIASRSRQHNNR
jgi:hypothetical protein